MRLSHHFTHLILGGILFYLLVSMGSCRKDMAFENLQHPLRFSADTLFLDTIAARTNSETFIFRAYNDRDTDINIPIIRLGNGVESKYRLNVDGRAGFEFFDTPLRANDSLTIFLSVVSSENPDEPFYEDFLEFSGHTTQRVMLYTVLQAAEYFITPENQEFLEINENTTWTSESVKIIFGKLRLAPGNSLQVENGTRVYFHRYAGLEIAENANLIVNGTLENQVNFRGLRHSTRYDSLPMQWKKIELMSNAHAQINYANIKGGETGLLMQPNSTAQITNTRIFNFSNSGIHAFNANITGSNLMISHAGDACLNIEGGGNYQFNHSTFANVWPVGLVGINGPAIPAYLADYYTTNAGELLQNGFEQAIFTNSIFYGRYPNGVVLDLNQENLSNILFNHCLINNQNTAIIDYQNHSFFQHIVVGNPLFEAANLAENNLRLMEDSPARNAGSLIFAQQAPQDFFGTNRLTSPNLGAIQ